MEQRDLLVIGGGPAGAAAAIRAARAGVRVTVFEKGPHGRDKVCGDGLTPRAVAALEELKVDIGEAHRIDGLRMIAGKRTRELAWPATGRFPSYGAVWPRRRFDTHLIDVAIAAGAEVRFGTEALPVLEDGAVVGTVAGGETFTAPLTILAAGAQGAAAKIVGCERDVDEPFGLAIRTYAATPRHAERLLEACLSLRDEHGTPVPGYGWMFPAGDGTVNIGVGALSTMKGFKQLNLNTLLDQYASIVREPWSLGPFLEKPRAWRLPMSAVRRHGPGWVAIGDAAGFVNPMNGEGIDYGLESGMLAVDRFLADPATAPATYDTHGRRALRRVPADRAPVQLPHRPPMAAPSRAAHRRRHAGGRRHHAGGDGQPRRQRDAGRRRPRAAARRSGARCGRPRAAANACLGLIQLRRQLRRQSLPCRVFISNQTTLPVAVRSVPQVVARASTNSRPAPAERVRSRPWRDGRQVLAAVADLDTERRWFFGRTTPGARTRRSCA